MKGRMSVAQSRYLAKVFDTPVLNGDGTFPSSKEWREEVESAYLASAESGERPSDVGEDILRIVDFALSTGKEYAEMKSDDVGSLEVILRVAQKLAPSNDNDT